MCYHVGVPIRARPRPVLALLAALAFLALAAQAGARANLFPTLYVDYVGTNCTFTLASDAGAAVTAIAPGTYQLTLTATDFESCGSGLPDFQLAGPGVLVQSPGTLGGAGSGGLESPAKLVPAVATTPVIGMAG